MNAANAPGIHIRRPATGDWSRVMQLLEEANFHRIGGPEMRRFEPENCVVAELDGTVVGVAGYAILDDATAKTTLLAVERAVHLRGIGSALQHHRLAYLRDQGISGLLGKFGNAQPVHQGHRHGSRAPD